MFELNAPNLKLVQTLLQARGAESIGNGVNKVGELSLYVGEFASFGLTEGVVFAALEIDFLETSDKRRDVLLVSSANASPRPERTGVQLRRDGPRPWRP